MTENASAPAPKSKLPLVLGGLLGAGCLCLGGCLILMVVAAKNAPPPRPITDVKADLAVIISHLDAVHAAVPAPDALQAQVADDAVIRKNYTDREARKYVDAVEYDMLKRFTNAPGVSWSTNEEWRWTGSIKFRDAKQHPRELTSRLDINNTIWSFSKLEKRRYLVVYRASERRMPEEGKGDSFTGGVYDGWLILMDYQTAEVVGAAPLQVRNSDTVEFKSRGITGTDAESAIESDFKSNFKSAAAEALKTITKELVLTM